jgi:antitoxin CptB
MRRQPLRFKADNPIIPRYMRASHPCRAGDMSGSTISSEKLDPRRRKLLFRAWHRGIKEMDLILGCYADRFIGNMPGSELDEFEAMLETSDRDLVKWFTNEEAVPEITDTPLFQRIQAHAMSFRS